MAIQFDEQEFLTRIYDKIEKIDANVTELRVTSARQEENIRTHIHRTDLAENNIDLLRKQLDNSIAEVNKKLEPIFNKENQILGMIKLGGVIGGAITVLGTIISIVYYFIK